MTSTLDYPQFLYIDGDVTKDARLVKNEEEQAAAEKAGYEAIPRHFGPGITGGPDAVAPGALDYPRHVYLEGDVEQESRLVRNSDEEAEAAVDGFARLAPVEPASSPKEDLANRARARSGRKPKP